MTKPPPNSLMAEEALLSALLLDPALVSDCIAQRIPADAFFHSHTRLMYEKTLELFVANELIGVTELALALGTDGMRAIGGYGKLTEIADRLPSTLTAKKQMRIVKDAYDARRLLLHSRSLAERLETFNPEDASEIELALVDAETQLQAIRSRAKPARPAKPITEFVVPRDDDGQTLIGDRFICRGHACLVVGGSGMGKSTLAYQMSVAWGLGKSILGIVPKRKLVSLHIQAEDEDGDVGEVWASVNEGMGCTATDHAILQSTVIIKTEKVARGAKFFQELKVLCARHKPDLVWVNPLHAYMDGDIKDAQAVGKFCREGLAEANDENKWAYMIVHHTPKPQVGSDTKQREWNEIMYEAAGSADLVNWARAVIVLKAKKEAGHFDLHLAKRGRRADVVKEITDAQGNPAWETTTRIPIRHSRGRIEVDGRVKPLPLLFWEPREESEEEKSGKEKPVRRGRVLKEVFTDGEMLMHFPPSTDEMGEALDTLMHTAESTYGIGKGHFLARRAELKEEGLIHIFENGYIKRTPRGDATVASDQRSRK